MQNVLAQFGSVAGDAGGGSDAIRARIDRFAARLATTPRALRAADRRALIGELKAADCLDVRRAMETVARHLGVSRATVYSDAK